MIMGEIEWFQKVFCIENILLVKIFMEHNLNKRACQTNIFVYSFLYIKSRCTSILKSALNKQVFSKWSGLLKLQHFLLIFGHP